MLTLLAATAHATSLGQIVTPSGVFAQAGFGENNTNAYVIGAVWNWHWQKQYDVGTVTGFSEASFGRWATDSGGVKGSAWATQIGLTPVIRLRPSAFEQPWFIEIGVGANVILPIYRSEQKRFSTEFNFGDHLSVGRQFGAGNRQEWAVRIQHFSNAGIKHPNPGENFLQLRYTYHY